MAISYTMLGRNGRTMSLSAETTSMLDESVDARDRDAIEREIKRDAQLLADELGHVEVETSDGIVLHRFEAHR